MGGKTSTSTAQTTIPPEVLARYNSVNTQAQNVAATPFQQYSTDPNAFVAPMTATQNAGVANTNAAATMAQPYFNSATGFALAGSQAVNPSAIDAGAINQFQNPYLNSVLGSTQALINQSNAQAMSGQLGNAITQGAYGGDRAGIAAATLAGQQQLAAGQTYSGIASDAFTQALQAAQQQQGVNLAAQQANRQALQQTGESLAGLGTGAESAALQGAQAQLGAGQVGQQTQQAGLTALYNQFLQQQSYPFQVAQFLANIAEGTGALSGSTTTQTTPGGLFMSDERLKEDMQPIGKGFDGANIYRFRYKGDPTTRIGFSAQETERRHPEAVHNVGGFKAIEQHAATEEAANKGGFANAANDNADDEPRRARQAGGYQGFGGVPYPGGVVPFDVAALLQAQEQMYGPYSGAGLYGGQASGAPHGGSSYVPAANLPIAHLQSPQVSAPHESSPLHQAAEAAGDVKGVAHDVQGGANWLSNQSWSPTFDPTKGISDAELAAATTPDSAADAAQRFAQQSEDPDKPQFGGGGFARAHRQYGGGDDISNPADDDPYQPKGPSLDIPTEGSHIQTLQGPKISGGGSGDSTMGDIMDIAKIAAMFAGNRGGRVPRAAGGEADPVEEALSGQDPEGSDPVENILLRRFEANLHQPPPAGFANANGGSGGSGGEPQAGGLAGGAPAPPPAGAGFAGVKPPSAPQAVPTGFAGASAEAPGTLGLFGRAEGTGKNPASSARGPFQLVDGTFLGLFHQMFPERAANMSRQDILALRDGPEGDQLSSQMAPVLAKQNAVALSHAGVDPEAPANGYTAWVLGPHDAIRVLKADPSTPLDQLVSPQSIAANPSIMKNKTAGQFVGWAGQRMAQMARRGHAAGGMVRRGYQTDGAVVDPDDPNNPRARQLQHETPQAVVHDPDVAAADAADTAAASQSQGLAGAGQPGPAAASAPAAQMTPMTTDDYQRSGLAATQAAQQDYAGLVHAQNQPKRGIMGTVTSPEFWIPALEGAAAWASAPTQHPLVAALVGAGTFAKGYQEQRAYDMTNARQNLEQTTLAAGAPTAAMGAQASMLSARAQAAQLAQQRFQQMYRPSTAYHVPGVPDGTPGWTDIGGNFISNDEHQRRYEQAIGPYVDAMSGVSAIPGGAGGANVGPASVAGGPTGGQLPGPTGGQQSSDTGRPASAGNQPAGNLGGTPPTGGGGTAAPSAAHHLSPNASVKEKLAAGYYKNTGVDLPTTQPQVPLQEMSDPEWLTQTGQRMIAMNRSPEEVKQGQQYVDWASQIKQGQRAVTDVNGNQYSGYADYQYALGQRQSAQQNFQQQKNLKSQQASEWGGASTAAWNLENNINRTYADNNTNRLTPQIAEVVGRLSSLPVVGPIVQKAWGDYEAASDVGAKLAAAQTIAQAAASHLAAGAPATVTGLINQTVPDPKMAPDARYELSVQTAQGLKWGQDYWNNWGKNQNDVDNVGLYDTDYANEHPMSRYEGPMSDNIPYFAGMTAKGKERFPRHPVDEDAAKKLPPGTPYVIPYGPRKGKIDWTDGKRDG